MVARKGSAPPTSGCRPDVILFHHRAEIGCRGWNRTSIRAFKGRCPTVRRPGKELARRAEALSEGWWPARVTRPVLRIKSPLHHFNACRPNWCSRQDLHPHWRRSRRRVSAVGLRELNSWSLQPVLPRHDFLTKEVGSASARRRKMVAVPGAALGTAGL